MVQFSLAIAAIALSTLSSMTLAVPLSSSRHYARDNDHYDLIARDYVDLATRDYDLEPELYRRSSPELYRREEELFARELYGGVPQELHRRGSFKNALRAAAGSFANDKHHHEEHGHYHHEHDHHEHDPHGHGHYHEHDPHEHPHGHGHEHEHEHEHSGSMDGYGTEPPQEHGGYRRR